MAVSAAFGQGQDSIRAVGGVLTINLVPSSTRVKVFVDQAITSTVFTNPIPTATITVLFVQDATGHTVTFGGNISGGCTVASTANATTACQFTFDSANNAWTGIGGSSGSVGTGVQVALAYSLSNLCLDQGLTNPYCYKTSADTQQANDCNWTAGQPDITCQTAHFASTDCVGGSGCTGTGTSKRAYGYNTCLAFQNLAAVTNNGAFTTSTPLTIASFISATHITLSGNAANTVSFASNFGGCVIWGHSDDTAAAALDTVVSAITTFCPKIFFAGTGAYMFTTFHFITNPPGCTALGSQFGHTASPSLGNLFYSMGYELEGRGRGPTVWHITPGFPESGTCTNGVSGAACWVIPLEGRWSDISVNGGGNYGTSIGGKNLIEVDGPASADRVTCVNFGGNAGGTSSNGILAYAWAQLTDVNNSGCGKNGLGIPNGSVVTAQRLAIENVSSRDVNVSTGSAFSFGNVLPSPYFDQYNFICYDCRLWPGNIAGTSPALLVNDTGGPAGIKLYHSSLSPNGNTANNLIGYDCLVAGCIFDAEDTFINMGANGVFSSGTGNVAINCTAACTVKLKNTYLGASATGGSIYTDGSASSRLYNLGGNSFLSGTTSSQVTMTGKAINPPSEAGTVTCATSAATITFTGTYLFSPLVTIQDQTTAGAVTQTSLSNTQKVVGCPGASDVLLYTVTPNPF